MIYQFNGNYEGVYGIGMEKNLENGLDGQSDIHSKQMLVCNRDMGRNILEQLDFHFMFNAMNTIKAMTLVDAERVRELIDALASVMRYRIRMLMEVELVPLWEELKQAGCFAYLEMGRYSKIRIEVEAPSPQYGDILIPGLTVVSLVDNAVRHGLRGKNNGGMIKVYLRMQDNECIVSVKDDGVGFIEPKKWLTHSGELNSDAYPSGGGMNFCSLRQIKERIENMAKGSLHIVTNGNGTIVEVHLPVK